VTVFTSNFMTVQVLAWGLPFSMNLFIPCDAAPFDRRTKPWTSLQAVGLPVQCASASNCANFNAPCSLNSSTECSGWIPNLNQGFYAP
jgi:hypothetical protein